MTYSQFQDFHWVQKNYSHHHPSMTYKINGEPVHCNQITLRSMNFGQPWHSADILEFPYTITIPLVFAIDLINTCLEDLYIDIRQYGVSSSLDEEIVKNKFPSDISGFISKQTMTNTFQQALIDFFQHDLLLRWFGDKATDQSLFSINTIEAFQVLESSVQFDGKAGKFV